MRAARQRRRTRTNVSERELVGVAPFTETCFRRPRHQPHERDNQGQISRSRKDTHMAATTSPSRPQFDLGSTVWIIIVAVLLVVIAAMLLYFK